MYLWIGFLLLIFILLALDLGLLNRKAHTVSGKEALRWTTLWVALSLLFSGVVYYIYEHDLRPNHLSGAKAMLTYLTGYLVEQSLSMDNIFVIAVIFNYFSIPPAYQHRVLFWGILGALFFRGLMIGIGVVLIERFEWIFYLFGILLLYSAYKMLTSGETVHPSQNSVIRLVKRFFPVTKSFHGERFFIRRRNILAVTPLFIALVVVETTDVMFAVDSIPAIFAITTDPFIVFTSNIFAILGLRSLYFVLASMLDKFHYLKYSLVAILTFVAAKMLLHDLVNFPEWLSLGFIVLSLGVGIAVSFWNKGPVPTEDHPIPTVLENESKL